MWIEVLSLYAMCQLFWETVGLPATLRTLRQCSSLRLGLFEAATSATALKFFSASSCDDQAAHVTTRWRLPDDHWDHSHTFRLPCCQDSYLDAISKLPRGPRQRWIPPLTIVEKTIEKSVKIPGFEVLSIRLFDLSIAGIPRHLSKHWKNGLCGTVQPRWAALSRVEPSHPSDPQNRVVISWSHWRLKIETKVDQKHHKTHSISQYLTVSHSLRIL